LALRRKNCAAKSVDLPEGASTRPAAGRPGPSPPARAVHSAGEDLQKVPPFSSRDARTRTIPQEWPDRPRGCANKPDRPRGCANKPDRLRGCANKPDRLRGCANKPVRLRGCANKPDRLRGCANKPDRLRGCASKPDEPRGCANQLDRPRGRAHTRGCATPREGTARQAARTRQHCSERAAGGRAQ